MLQTLINTQPYAQPLSPIEVKGDRYALPDDFVSCLAFLRPFVQRRGDMIEQWVHLLRGKLYVITNNLVIDYVIGNTDLPHVSFGPNVIRVLEAFETPPNDVSYEFEKLNFRWSDGQEFYINGSQGYVNHRPIYPSSQLHEKVANDAFERFLQFNDCVVLTDDARKNLRQMLCGSKKAKDIFLNDQAVLSRMSSDGKTWTSETITPFESGAERMMRFDRSAFLAMIKVAHEVSFLSSPVCFRHEHGRGMLIERTLGSDLPDFEEMV